MNAATEFPEASHPVHEAVAAHRAWQRTEFTKAAEQAGVADPIRLGGRLQLLYDGALAGAKAAREVRPITEGAVLAAVLLATAEAGSAPAARQQEPLAI